MRVVSLQLVFFESDQLARAALYYYLRRLGLAIEVKTSLVYAQNCQLTNSITSNTAADWVDRGMNLLQQQVGVPANAHSRCTRPGPPSRLMCCCGFWKLLVASSYDTPKHQAVLTCFFVVA